MELYNKYRPKSFSEVVGNEDAIKSIKAELEHGSHTFLLNGPAGCGKTTLAYIMANELGANDMSIHIINSSSNTGIDTVRQIEKEVQYAPMTGDCSVYILDEVHMQSSSAQNAILKVLEDCPEYVYFFLCTTDPQKLIKALQTRCSIVTVKALSHDQMTLLLRKVCHKEGVKVSVDILEQVADLSEGSGRRALKTLAAILYLDNDEERRNYLKNNTVSDENKDAIEFARVLARGASWEEITAALKTCDLSNPEGIRQLILSYANTILMKGLNGNAMAMLMGFTEADTYKNGKFALTYGALNYLNYLKS